MNPMQMLGMLQKSHNPFGLLQQLSQNNPKMQRVIDIVRGKSPKEIEQYVRNTAQTQGIDLNKLAQDMGLQLPH